jgi:uncharacterized membrane protein
MLERMPNIAQFHPQIVHFAIALLLAGVVMRWLSLTGKVAFAGPAATTALLCGTIAAVLAATSGTQAHGPVERIPGVAAAVQAHEHWGERARTVFLIVAGLEIVALVLSRLKLGLRRWAEVASALVGLVGGYAIFEAAEHGGELVYSYAGGPGLRTGDTADIGRLLAAGLYQQAMVDRARHESAGAAALIDELARRTPGDTAVALVRVESLLRDRGDPNGALAALAALNLPADNPRLAVRSGMLAADAWAAAGQPDSARAVLRGLLARFPANQRLKERLAQLGG